MPLAVYAAFLVPILGFPLVFYRLAARIDRQVEQSRSWSQTRGRILSSRASETENGWSARLRYTYTAGGQERRGSRYRFGGTSGTGAEMHDIVRRHPEGASVTVWYDPARPDRAVLDRSGDSGALRIAGLIVGGVFAATLLLVVILG